jgi:hypothetical protein
MVTVNSSKAELMKAYTDAIDLARKLKADLERAAVAPPTTDDGPDLMALVAQYKTIQARIVAREKEESKRNLLKDEKYKADVAALKPIEKQLEPIANAGVMTSLETAHFILQIQQAREVDAHRGRMMEYLSDTLQLCHDRQKFLEAIQRGDPNAELPPLDKPIEETIVTHDVSEGNI